MKSIYCFLSITFCHLLLINVNAAAGYDNDPPIDKDVDTIERYVREAFAKEKTIEKARIHFCSPYDPPFSFIKSVREKSGEFCGKNQYIDEVILLVCHATKDYKDEESIKDFKKGSKNSACYDRIRTPKMVSSATLIRKHDNPKTRGFSKSIRLCQLMGTNDITGCSD